MKQVAVAHVRFPGDWEALYIQGRKVVETHNISVSDVLTELEGYAISYATSERRNVNLVEEFGGRAPDEYSAIPSDE